MKNGVKFPLNIQLFGSDDLPEDQPTEFDPLGFIDSLVEQNQDDTDFIANAQSLRNIVAGDEVTSLRSQLENEQNENKRLKKQFYDTFMGQEVPEDFKVDEVEEKPPLSLDDIVNSIK